MLLALCLAAFAAAVSVMFAWMTNIRYIHSAEFQIKQIESTIDMYIGIDENYNGVPDLLSSHDVNDGTYRYNETANDWRTYESLYYAEKYAFQIYDSKYMLSVDDSASTFEDYTIEDAEPSRIYTFKFAVTKHSQGDATLSFSFDKFTTDTSTAAAYFECRIYTVTNTGEETDYASLGSPTDWTAFSSDGTALIGTANNNAIALAYASGTQQDVWLQIRLKSSVTEAEVAQSASVKLPRFVATIELSTETTGDDS